MSLREFFSMGGYAMYVWPAFLITLGILLANVVAARGSLRRARANARRLLQAREGRP